MMAGNHFTAHNIRLDDGSLTMDAISPEFSQQPVLKAAKRILKTLYQGANSGKLIVDLGCLEGGYAVEFAREGFQSIGIEVRDSNFANCLPVKRGVDLPNLTFVQDDVRNVRCHGPFDVGFCCGLLYHLDKPAAFLKALGDACSKAVIINTRYASETGNHGQPKANFAENEGYLGLWYGEYSPDQEDSLDAMKWASWGNPTSFWPTKAALAQMVQDAGFDLVFEQYDWLEPRIDSSMTDGYYAQDSRTMIVGVKN